MATKQQSETGQEKPLIEELSAWPNVSIAPHRFSAVEFTLGDREIGHVHQGRVLDINFPKRIHDLLIAEGRTNEHHIAGGGWTTYYVNSEADIEDALWLLRIAYLHTALIFRRKPVGEEVLVTLDVADELAALELSDELQNIFDSMYPPSERT